MEKKPDWDKRENNVEEFSKLRKEKKILEEAIKNSKDLHMTEVYKIMEIIYDLKLQCALIHEGKIRILCLSQ